MTQYNLTQSPVIFSENPHGYSLNGKRLLGITGLIHDILQLGVYPDASDFVKQTAIPRAGEYGSSVHKAIETYDQIGIKQTVYHNSFGPEPWDVSAELETYIRHRAGYSPLANEYTVSDEKKWASNIDNIWTDADGNIILVDTKTNNLNYYPGGAPALQEYLSWQLSIYAYLFERQNPGLKVASLACNWLRKGEGQFWEIARKTDAEVELLLLADYEFDENGVPHYSHPCPEALVTKAVIPSNTKMIVAEDVIRLVYVLTKQEQEAKAKGAEMKKLLRAAMEKESMKSWDSGLFKATIAADSETTSFDLKRFKKDYPELAAQYMVKKAKKGGFTIKLRDK